jgi:hypothetical protein
MIRVMLLTAALMFPVGAQAMDLDKTFVGEDGVTLIPDELDPRGNLKCGDIIGHPCLTLRAAIFHALVRPYSDEPNVSGDEKYWRGDLASKVQKARRELVLSPKEVITAKTVIGKLYTPLIIHQAYQLLDPSLIPAPEVAGGAGGVAPK